MQAAMSNTVSPKPARDRSLVEGVLSNVPLLRGATPLQVALLGSQSWTLQAKRLERVVTKGERLPGVLAIAYGTVKVSLSRRPGDDGVIRFVHAGQTIGESTALLGRAAAFGATAIDDCKLVVIPSAGLFALIERDPRCARQIVLALAQRDLELLAELEASRLLSGAQRLAGYLSELAEGGGTARLPASKTLVAARLDMSKETLSRLLHSMAARGLVEVDGSAIRILDRASLAALAE